MRWVRPSRWSRPRGGQGPSSSMPPQKGALSTRAAANALVHRGELAEPTIHRAEAIPATRGTGQTIGETAPASTSADEFRQLWHYVAWRLGLRDQPETMLDIDVAPTTRTRKVRAG